MTSASRDALDDKVNQVFAGKCVRKDLVRAVKVGANVPVFVLEYLLGKYCASSDAAAIKGDSQVPVPTAAWSWNPSEQFATPNGAACFNTGGSYAYAQGGISLQECLTPVQVVSGGADGAPAAAITEISWKGLRCNLEVSGGTAGMTADLRREAAGGPSVATAAKPVDDGGARLLVEDDELEGAAVVAVLLSPDGRVIAQRRTVVGGEA